MTDSAAVERLKGRDYELLIDTSASMGTRDVNGKSRWEAVQESTKAIVNRISEFDPDGITLYTFAGSFKRYDNVLPEAVDRIFAEKEPMGSTAMHLVLADVFAKWRDRKRAGKLKKGTTVLVVTDGTPDNENAVANEIKLVTKAMEQDEELGISFLQIGNDRAAQQYLKRLDDDLQKEGAKFDVVDTKTFDELENVTLTEALIAALDD